HAAVTSNAPFSRSICRDDPRLLVVQLTITIERRGRAPCAIDAADARAGDGSPPTHDGGRRRWVCGLLYPVHGRVSQSWPSSVAALAGVARVPRAARAAVARAVDAGRRVASDRRVLDAAAVGARRQGQGGRAAAR